MTFIFCVTKGSLAGIRRMVDVHLCPCFHASTYEIQSTSYVAQIISGLNRTFPLIFVSRPEPPLNVSTHALQGCRCNDTCRSLNHFQQVSLCTKECAAKALNFGCSGRYQLAFIRPLTSTPLELRQHNTMCDQLTSHLKTRSCFA